MNGLLGVWDDVDEDLRYNFVVEYIAQSPPPPPPPEPVPVPAAFWLFGTALVGLVGIKRKK